ncbi:hypothetical protein [Oricola sp.]|uniref:hypothetical protein n=1 Tax=Oricola sp. TaxID=1979950 RepID=UPI003BAA7A8D
MSTYTAVVVHSETGGEGRYDFDYDGDLLARSPVKVVRAFMDVVDKKYLPSEQVDYEINAALKSPSGNTVTAMGSLIHEGDGASPFMMMISKKPS